MQDNQATMRKHYNNNEVVEHYATNRFGPGRPSRTHRRESLIVTKFFQTIGAVEKNPGCPLWSRTVPKTIMAPH